MIISVLLELKVNESKKKKNTHTHYPLIDMLLNDVTTYLSSMI